MAECYAQTLLLQISLFAILTTVHQIHAAVVYMTGGTNVPNMSPGASPLPSVHSESACVIKTG